MVTKSKGLKKASESKDSYRLHGIPLIQDRTELITPELAEKMLQKNKKNRPINWNKVEEYRKLMDEEKWEFHAQGIILDNNDNIITGQKRLWAIIYSSKPQYMRISKGSPTATAHLIDRGTPQSSRDLASRSTDRKHSPTEASIIRAMFAIHGKTKPSKDEISEGLVVHNKILDIVMKQTRGLKKTKERLMIIGAICELQNLELLGRIEILEESLKKELLPLDIKSYWNKGAAFMLSMKKALKICKSNNCQKQYEYNKTCIR